MCIYIGMRAQGLVYHVIGHNKPNLCVKKDAHLQIPSDNSLNNPDKRDNPDNQNSLTVTSHDSKLVFNNPNNPNNPPNPPKRSVNIKLKKKVIINNPNNPSNPPKASPLISISSRGRKRVLKQSVSSLLNTGSESRGSSHWDSNSDSESSNSDVGGMFSDSSQEGYEQDDDEDDYDAEEEEYQDDGSGDDELADLLGKNGGKKSRKSRKSTGKGRKRGLASGGGSRGRGRPRGQSVEGREIKKKVKIKIKPLSGAKRKTGRDSDDDFIPESNSNKPYESTLSKKRNLTSGIRESSISNTTGPAKKKFKISASTGRSTSSVAAPRRGQTSKTATKLGTGVTRTGGGHGGSAKKAVKPKKKLSTMAKLRKAFKM